MAGDPWGWWRERMPVAERWAWLDHAAVAPLSGPAATALGDFAEEASRQGAASWSDWAAELEQFRDELADWWGGHRDEIALVPNTSFGINVVAQGLRWRRGDNVVIPAGEFPANIFPWQNQRRRGVELRVVALGPGGAVDIDALIAAIDGRTRIVAASWVGYASGYRVDLEQLVERVHRAGALILLDAIQALGVFPLDLAELPIDFLAADGHKWLLGPEGAGVLFIRRQHLDVLDPLLVGWNSVRSAHRFAAAELFLKPDASRWEIGSQNIAGMRALRGSVQLLRAISSAHGRWAIAERVLELAGRLEEGLRGLGASVGTASVAAHRSGIVPFALAGESPQRIRRMAAQQQVAVSCRGIGVRASLHGYNNLEDIQRLIDVLGRLR